MSNLSKRASARHLQGVAISVGKTHSVAKRSVESSDKKSSIVGLYSLKTKDSIFGVPFVAFSDSLALDAGKQLLPIANVFKVGSFCLNDGKYTPLSRPVLVLDNKVS